MGSRRSSWHVVLDFSAPTPALPIAPQQARIHAYAGMSVGPKPQVSITFKADGSRLLMGEADMARAAAGLVARQLVAQDAAAASGRLAL
jgi:hypothetical protein